MSTELDSRIWFKNNYNCYEELLKLVKVISTLEICTNEWNNLSVSEKVYRNVIYSDNTANTLNTLNSKLDINKIDDYKISIDVPIKCWRFSGREVENGFVVLKVSCWGKNFGASFEFDLAIEGNAQISILNAGPFCAVISENEREEILKVNQFVEQNTEKYIDLILKISEVIAPLKILTYTDAGQYILCNVQMAYYDNLSLIKEDLSYFKSLMIDGNGTYNIKPITNLELSSNNFQLHQWRDLKLQEELKNRIINLINKDFNISLQKVELILSEGKYDCFDKEGKHLIMDYPFLLNNFLSDFYFDIVD